MRAQSLLVLFLPIVLLASSAWPHKKTPHQSALPQTIRVGVMTIFQPQRLTITAIDNTPLVVTAAGQSFFLQPRSPSNKIAIYFSGGSLVVQFAGKELHAESIRCASRNNSAADFLLIVPDKIERGYRGTLDIAAHDAALVPVVTMDLEIAVATVVQSESPPDAPFEMLKAQAVAARSYFRAAHARHIAFDFCDLTHCQTLRNLPAANSAAVRATKATQGEVLLYQGAPVPAMYTRSCSGNTLTPATAGMPVGDYPFQSVLCEFCSQNPVRWTRKLSSQAAPELLSHNESSRLELCRRLGWSAVPSNTFEAHQAGREVVLEGIGYGHGIGLCQRGAQALARQGLGYQAILQHYFPGTQISAENLPIRR